jgi:5-methylcytosine-specific restriction endonuclease McrA
MMAFLPKRPRIRLPADSYERLRREVLERDGWRCQHCGRMSELQVHHIRSRSSLGDDNLDNLITLCCDCHREAHCRMGKT